jgi:hypothetical protein
MIIRNLRILPPFAIGRFGSSETPLEAFDLEVLKEAPLDFQRIVPKPTLEIDPSFGVVKRMYTPERIRFREKNENGTGAIRPVCPFLEVYGETAENNWEPLTLDILAAEGLAPDAVRWTVEVANLKAFRQTHDDGDKVLASVKNFSDHTIHELRGQCAHFYEGKFIPFGNVRYIKPTPEFPEIRIRFTPAKGIVYGASKKLDGFDKVTKKPLPTMDDPLFKDDPDDSRIVYDPQRGKWRGFYDDQSIVPDPLATNPGDIYEGFNQLFCRGYFDDVCDGPVSVELTLKSGVMLRSRAWISAAMPGFAPDSRPVRTVADELEQLILGPDVDDAKVSIDEAAEIVRRAIESIRLMNTMVMNGNVIDGRPNIAHTLGTQDTGDYGRLYAPIMASTLADNLAVRALHERIYAALKSGAAPWFASVLRRPEEVGDLSDKGRRKMPPMLRGADSRALALTRRQISKIVKAATLGIFQ